MSKINSLSDIMEKSLPIPHYVIKIESVGLVSVWADRTNFKKTLTKVRYYAAIQTNKEDFFVESSGIGMDFCFAVLQKSFSLLGLDSSDPYQVIRENLVSTIPYCNTSYLSEEAVAKLKVG